MKHVHIILAVVLVCASVARSTELTGVVVNPQGEPLAGVSVVTNVAGVGTTTQDAGDFRLVCTDTVKWVTFSSVGYHSRQFSLGTLPDTVVLEPLYYRTDRILVTADRAESGVTPIAFDNVSQEEIKRDYLVGEFPLLLKTTPNLYTYSDAGSVLGYSSVKIRGFDDKRVATYINGVPLNDPEEQATYFVDLPDFAANITDIQVQRGVGNSLYGDASFGGVLNIVTKDVIQPRRTVLTAGYGGYTADGKNVSDIYKQSVEYSSGLIEGRWHFTGRFSKQKTGGYRHDSWYHGWAYYFSIARLTPRMTTELYLYGGPMRMHLAYYGISREDIARDRRWNPLTYPNATDNFNQPHYQLHNTYRLNENMMLSNTLYYIRGKGYYEQYKKDRSYVEYNLTNYSDSASGDLVRQKWVTKNQVGWNPHLTVEHSKGRFVVGGSFYTFSSHHWGQVVSAEFLQGTVDPTHRYYTYYGKKKVGSLYAQELYHLTDKLSLHTAAQLRYIHYNFNQEKIGAFKGYRYSLDWLFFSPRIGVSYAVTPKLSLHTNFAISSRSPTDDAIYDADDPWLLPSLQIKSLQLSTAGDDTLAIEFGDPTAKPERVYDIELGGEYRASRFRGGVNLFWMDFRNEILPYGGLNDNGVPITTNADRSLHSGVELTASVRLHRDFELSGNFSYNYNRVKKFVADVDGFQVDFKDKHLTGYPEYLGNLIADYTFRGLRLTGYARFIGKQYMELYNIDSLAISPYAVFSLAASWTLADFASLGNLVFSLRVDNLFDKKYISSGYGGNFAYEENGKRVVDGWAEYFPAAERSYFGQVKLEIF